MSVEFVLLDAVVFLGEWVGEEGGTSGTKAQHASVHFYASPFISLSSVSALGNSSSCKIVHSKTLPPVLTLPSFIIVFSNYICHWGKCICHWGAFLFENIPLVRFMYIVFICVPGRNYCR